MADTFEQHYRVAYEEALGIDSQQKTSKIAAFVDADLNYDEKGESFNVGNIGESDPSEVDDKYGELPSGHVDKRRRWGHFNPWDDGKILGSSIDKARQVADPSNEIVLAMKAGLARRQDACVYQTMIGTTYSGKNGTTSVTLPDAQKIAVDDHTFDADSGNAAMTLSKLILAMTKLDEMFVDGEKHIAMPSAQVSRLLAYEDQMTNSDYAAVKALVNGEINQFYGFTFHKYEPVSTDSAGDQLIVAWAKPAIVYKQRTLEAPDVWKRKDKRPHWYAYYMIDQAVTRREDKGVIQIACSPVATS